MRMRPVVPHIKPKKLLEWDELNSHEPVTHLSYRNSAMLVYESEFYPVAYGGGVPDKATDEDEALRVAEVGSLVAATRASKRDLGGGIASLAYLSLVAAIVIMVILWSFMFTPTILERFNNDSDEPPVAQRGPL